jgi:phospholipid/cholesterol/gamma-HCH transport system substrate-binding protein
MITSPKRVLRAIRSGTRRAAVTLIAAMLLSACGTWQGIASVPMPGGPGTGKGSYTIYVQVPDALALNVNSRVRVADVFVGSVRNIELKNWIATLTVALDEGVTLPVDVAAKIGQTSLLGSQHVELVPPPNPSPVRLRSGDTIPLQNSTAFPTTERTLASIGSILSGGGIANLEVIQTEVNNILSGNADQVREFLNRLDVFTAELNAQRDDIARAIDSTNKLLGIVAARKATLDRVLTEFPPLIKHFADTRRLFTDAVIALGNLSHQVDAAASESRADLEQNLRTLQRPLKQLGRASPRLIGALKLILTAPFNIDNVPRVVRGDYANISGTFDLTLSSLDNALLTGTRFSGALRALEQAWGRDPATMIPDVRFTPNPNDVPPERGQ